MDSPARSGIDGLDDILASGFTRNRLYVVEGVPGSGKTTLALQFLLRGAEDGETSLYVTLSESDEELRAVAASHGWSLDRIVVREILSSASELNAEEHYTMFHPAEVELPETTRTILEDIERIKPSRVVFDSLSEFRLLAGNALQYRRQILALKQYLSLKQCTVLLLDDLTTQSNDLQVQSIAHGVIRLEQMYPEYGAERRRLSVIKYRGVAYRGGYHDYRIVRGGLAVFPRLVASEHHAAPLLGRLESGNAELDQLTGGGLERGTSTLVVGAAGTGKSTLAAQFAAAAAGRGQRSVIFAFDEGVTTLLTRCESLGIPLVKACDDGLATVRQIDPAMCSPGELTHEIRLAVEEGNLALLIIDSLNGYINSMPEERYLIIQLHELLMYLGQAGVATILIGAHQGLIGANMKTPADASYLADAVILMRYFETRGEVRQAISVLKKRGGRHERSIREFGFSEQGINVGEPLRDFRGVLTGVPVYDPDGEPQKSGSS